MSKKRILNILNIEKPESRSWHLQKALEDYKGQFAVKFFLEAALELLGPVCVNEDAESLRYHIASIENTINNMQKKPRATIFQTGYYE